MHCLPRKKGTLKDLAEALRPLGLRPIFSTARRMIGEELHPFEIASPQVFDKSVEAFVAAEQDRAILARIDEKSGEQEQTRSMDLVFISEGRPVQELLDVVARATGVELLDHSSREDSLVDQVHERITSTSPNGKLLEDVETRAAALSLEDDNIRAQLKELSATIGAISVPRPELEKLPVLKDAGAVDRLIASGALTSNFQIQCGNCNISHLVFADRRDAERNLGGSVKCTCGKSRLCVVETYGVEKKYQLSLQQGLWLEAFVTSCVDPIVCRCWTGKILGTDEVDVICVIADRIVMVECKDRAVGQNDLYVAAIKAQSLGADRVLIVSTHPLHANVVEVLSGLNQQRGGADDRFTPIISSSAAEIRENLIAFLNSLRKREFNNWLTGGAKRLDTLFTMNWDRFLTGT